MNTLRLLIDSGWPHRHQECCWYFCVPDGTVLQHGHDTPAHWPGVCQPDNPQVCDLILDSSQAACFRVMLPKGVGHAEQATIGTALEEALLDDPSQYQFLKLSQENREGPAECTVAALSRLRLASLLQQMTELGLRVASVWMDGCLLPEDTTGRVAWLTPERLTLPLPAGGFLGLDTGEGLPETLRQLAPRLAQPSLTVHVCHTATPVPAWLQTWQDALGMPVQAHQQADTRFPLRIPPAGGFLHGAFAPARPHFLSRQAVRQVLRHSALMGAALLLLLLLQWGGWAIQADHLRQDMATLFRQQFPQAVMVEPLLQVQRQLEQKQAQQGHLHTGDFLFLLDRLSAQPDLPPGPMQYVAGRLQLELTLEAVHYHALLRTLSAQGLFAHGKGEIRQGRFTGTLTVSARAIPPDAHRPENRNAP